MDISLTKKHFHCIGIGGIGLSAIAEILIKQGHRVTGSDVKETDISNHLKKLGAEVYIGHKGSQIGNCDMVIYTAAVSDDNPELIEAKAKSIPAISRAEMLGILMKNYPYSIAISGTHGKTTTTSMVSLILEDALMDPTILVGGHLDEIGGNVKIGSSPYFVTEACEYVDSFLKLNPKIEIILNIDSDHLDYFKDIEHIVSSFQKFTEAVPESGFIVAYSGNAFVKSIINQVKCNVITFGFDSSCDYYAANIIFNTDGMPKFDVFYGGGRLCTIQLSIPGEHNINNSLAAIACCHTLGVTPESISKTLERFEGTKRRFDIIGIIRDTIKIIDDYAHHPEEIKATLKACINVPHNKLWCIFQPHTYTRTKALFEEFINAFDLADEVIITDIYAAREKNVYQISALDLVNEIKKKKPEKHVRYISDFEDIAEFIMENVGERDLVITMGAGDIYKAAECIIEKSK